MSRKVGNVAAAQARLLRLARESKLSLQDLPERYGIERLLYRLSLSEHRSRFVLKGATFREICAVAVAEDGMEFEVESVAAEETRAEPECVGVTHAPTRQPE